MEKNKKRAVAEALAIASEIEVPAEALLKESSVEDAQKVVELEEGIKESVVADLLKFAEGVQRKDFSCSEATGGNTSSHIISNNIVEIEYTSTSSDTMDDTPLSRVYENLYKSLAPSPSTKHQKKPVDDVFEPMYPIVLERIGEMAQMRIDVCQRLPVDHHLRPPFIQPLQTIPVEALLKESSVEDAQKVVELAEGIKELVVADDLLKFAEGVQRKDFACSEAGTSEVDASEATGGNTSSYIISNNIVEIESTSTTSLDTMDDIPMSRVYENLYKSLAPSPSIKHQKKPVDDVFELMYSTVLERICEMAQMRINVCQRLPADHPLQSPFIQPLQTIPVDESEKTEPESDIPTTSSSQRQQTTQTSDPYVLEELANHYQGELPSFRPNSEIASEITSDGVVLESPQQHQPNSQMASNTCYDLIIHPDFKPYHLNATHSNISFGIALRNIANKRSFFVEQSDSDNNSSLSEETIFVVQPLSVVLPSESSEATLDPQSSVQPPLEPEFMITSDSSVGDEQPIQTGATLDPSAPFVLESIHDEPYVAPNLSTAIEISCTKIPSSSTTISP